MLQQSKKETILKEEIQENTLAIYLEDEPINYIPAKDLGYTLDITKSSCNNGVEISFDYNTWSVKTNYSNYTNPDNTRVKCSLYFTSTYIESLLNGTDPVLEEPLIPVTISDDGVVRKANLSSEWYNYETKKWANAVILEDESKNYASGDIIPEENIESYFAWIPKYRYQLWDLGLYDGRTTIEPSKVHEISVIFGDYNTSDNVEGECTTPMVSGESGNCEVGDYMTHPAFLSIPSTGFWVGKFETGYKGATTKEEAEVNERDASKVQIKPNGYSWRGLQSTNSFYTSFDYKRELDSHMMKNTEWGAVAYLQHSTYGSATSVRMNNNSDFKTGYQANEEPTCGYTGQSEECNRYCNDNTCNTAYPNSNLASTTGNITGIFDMSGGAYDGVMAVLADQNGNPMSGRNKLYNSGFNGTYGCPTCDNQSELELTTGENFPEEKYYDKYKYMSLPITDFYDRRILGDATGELGPFEAGPNDESLSSWYKVQISFINTNSPWASRGNLYSNGTYTGILAGNTNYGNGLVYSQISNTNATFRIILTPTR
ncbi:TPA: hypothetical protein IAB95_01565 [Candidatus Ventrenecus avicola]|nr:hypothetical protein [Candidatus Ventrenecus avicola]